MKTLLKILALLTIAESARSQQNAVIQNRGFAGAQNAIAQNQFRPRPAYGYAPVPQTANIQNLLGQAGFSSSPQNAITQNARMNMASTLLGLGNILGRQQNAVIQNSGVPGAHNAIQQNQFRPRPAYYGPAPQGQDASILNQLYGQPGAAAPLGQDASFLNQLYGLPGAQGGLQNTMGRGLFKEIGKFIDGWFG